MSCSLFLLRGSQVQVQAQDPVERESPISSLSHRDPKTPDIAQKKADRFELLVCATMPNPNTTLHINSEMSTVHPLKSSPPLLATHRAFAQKAKLPTFIIVQSTSSQHGLRYTNKGVNCPCLLASHGHDIATPR